MPWRKDGSFILDDTELIPPGLRTREEEARIRRNNSPEQRALDRKMEEDFRARRGVFAKFPKKKRKTSKKGSKCK